MSAPATTPVSATCHCGAVRVTIPGPPEKATQCNCSLCRRVGGLWSYYRLGEVTVEAGDDALAAYVWGDRSLQNWRCRHCGCATHWTPAEGQNFDRMAVNLRLFDPEALGRFRIRQFDGADSWTYVGEW